MEDRSGDRKHEYSHVYFFCPGIVSYLILYGICDLQHILTDISLNYRYPEFLSTSSQDPVLKLNVEDRCTHSTSIKGK